MKRTLRRISHKFGVDSDRRRFTDVIKLSYLRIKQAEAARNMI